MHARMQHHCTHARRQYTIPSTNSGEWRAERSAGGVHWGRSAHRLAGQLKIFLGGRAGVPCALYTLPARLGVSAHLGAPSLSGKRITAMYEGAMSRCTSRFVRHHYTRHHHIRHRDVRSSPGHTFPLITLEYPSRVSTHHALHVAHHATPPRLAASNSPTRQRSILGEESTATATPHTTPATPTLPQRVSAFRTPAWPPPRTPRHAPRHARTARSGRRPALPFSRARAARFPCGRVVPTAEGSPGVPGGSPRRNCVHGTAAAARRVVRFGTAERVRVVLCCVLCAHYTALRIVPAIPAASALYKHALAFPSVLIDCGASLA